VSCDSKFLRGQLASVGIFLDEPTPRQAHRALEQPMPGVDRDEVRRILMSAGAPPRDLDWLTASCPSIEDALGYVAPTPEAWCVVCDGPRMLDQQGRCTDPEHGLRFVGIIDDRTG
jgi:hypothetical protein